MPEIQEGRHAAEFVLSEAARNRSRDEITIESGAGIIAPGTVLGAKSTGKYIASTVATADGAQVAKAVNLYEVDATSSDVKVAAITRDAEINGAMLSYAADADTDPEKLAKRVQLAAVGIIAR